MYFIEHTVILNDLILPLLTNNKQLLCAILA